MCARHVQCARAQRELYNSLKELSKLYPSVHVLVVDFGQNMELPYFGRTQAGDTYYYSYLGVYNLRVVDTKLDHLHVHLYHEGEGKKGGNNVASLVMKSLITMKLINDFKTPGTASNDVLHIVFDNCSGQNKNNMVLCLVPYLVDMGFFREVHFIFLVIGHTKNVRR